MSLLRVGRPDYCAIKPVQQRPGQLDRDRVRDDDHDDDDDDDDERMNFNVA